MNDWHFDPISAVIGAVLALSATWAAYRQRKRFARLRDQIKQGVRRLIGKVTASLEERYKNRFARWAKEQGILAHLASIDQVFVPPPLLPPLPSPDPELKQAPARTPLPWKIALTGHNRLAILGEPGSGRTSVLTYLGMERAQPTTEETDDKESPASPGRIPLYLSLPALTWRPPEPATPEEVEREEGEPAEEPEQEQPPEKELSPVDRLIRSALSTLDGGTTFFPVLRQELEQGNALILADGWDELTPEHQDEAAQWLGQLADQFPENVWIVTAAPRGFVPLAREGFTPIQLGPWTAKHARALMEKWVGVLEPKDDKKKKEEEEKEGAKERPLDRRQLIGALQSALQQGARPFELTLTCWLFFDKGELPQVRSEIFDEAVDHLLEPPQEDAVWSAEMARVALRQLALTLQEEGRRVMSRQDLLAALETVLPAEGERPPRLEDQIIQVAARPGGLLRRLDENEYVFAHPLWQAYLASQQIATFPPEVLLEHLEDPRWESVVDFYAAAGPMEPVIKAWLSRPDDLWYTRLRRTARWAAIAPPNAKWRNGVMALLARKLLNGDLPLAIRQQLAKALIQTGDPGVVYFLRQAADHSKTAVRVAALEALGHLAGEADLPTLEIALDDPEAAVREAAVVALGTMGGRAAIHRLTRLLIEAEQELRVEAARALVRCEGEAWEILQEALQEEDILTRRAAVYGLAEVPQPWARDLLVKMTREDSEWIVRSAAETALEMVDTPAKPVEPPLEISEAGWLISWAAQRNEPVGRGESALPVLLRALEEGRPNIQRAAIRALGSIGRPEHMPLLRRKIEEGEPEIAAIAMEALEEIARRHDITIQS